MVPALGQELSRWAVLEAPAGSCHGDVEIQPLSKIIFVLLASLEFSALSKMCFISEEGVIIRGCGRSQYIAIRCLTFNIYCRFFFGGVGFFLIIFLRFDVLFAEAVAQLLVKN